METLYESFQSIPLESLGLQHLLVLIGIVGFLIFKLVIPKPRKKDKDK